MASMALTTFNAYKKVEPVLCPVPRFEDLRTTLSVRTEQHRKPRKMYNHRTSHINGRLNTSFRNVPVALFFDGHKEVTKFSKRQNHSVKKTPFICMSLLLAFHLCKLC